MAEISQWIIIGIIIFSIIAYANPQIIDDAKEKIDDINEKVIVKSNSAKIKEVDECIGKFKTLIPDIFVLERRQSYDDWRLFDGFGRSEGDIKLIDKDIAKGVHPFDIHFLDEVKSPKITKWKDGTDFNNLRIKYRQGANIGENTNFYYAESDSFSSDSTELGYNKRIVDKEGNIIGDNTFMILVTLRPIENTLQDLGVYTKSGYILYDIELQFFEIAEYLITGCNLVEII